MEKSTILLDTPKRGYVICDIDGTVADATHRMHFVKINPSICDCSVNLGTFKMEHIKDGCPIKEFKKDWKGFFEAMSNDTPRKDIIQTIRAEVVDGYDICFVSGRPDTYKKITIEWLDRHIGIEDYYLLMRKGTDKRPDDIVKFEILKTYFPKLEQIKHVFDDRPSVIRMWRAFGLDVIDVGHGIEF